jgi:hypothetical protein
MANPKKRPQIGNSELSKSSARFRESFRFGPLFATTSATKLGSCAGLRVD